MGAAPVNAGLGKAECTATGIKVRHNCKTMGVTHQIFSRLSSALKEAGIVPLSSLLSCARVNEFQCSAAPGGCSANTCARRAAAGDARPHQKQDPKVRQRRQRLRNRACEPVKDRCSRSSDSPFARYPLQALRISAFCSMSGQRALVAVEIYLLQRAQLGQPRGDRAAQIIALEPQDFEVPRQRQWDRSSRQYLAFGAREMQSRARRR